MSRYQFLVTKDSILFEILFLGTSASAPSAKRGLSAQIVKHDEYRFLIDCGEGTQRQILQSGTGFKNLTRILLTHGHLDHILGLGGLLSTFLRWEAIEELDIFLPDGRRVRPDDVLGPLQKGVKLVVVGDAGRTDDLLHACKDADALVIESTYTDEEAEMARLFSHLTARQGAELAVKAGVKKLILTHISRRYREKDILKEAQAIFPNTSVARDFDSFQIKREES